MATEPKIEHPSGLRDAIEHGISHNYALGNAPLGECIEFYVRAWLSVVSEGEIEAVAKALAEADGYRWEASGTGGLFASKTYWRTLAAVGARASREVLIPKEPR